MVAFASGRTNCSAEEHQHRVNSTALGEIRKIRVSLPDYYKLRSDEYDVIFLLDGDRDALFRLAVANKRMLETSAVDLGDFRPAPSIIIAIEQEERSTDFASSAFRKFLTDELISFVDEKYRTNGYRVIIGHSLAGSFALREAIQQDSPFSSIIAISPAIKKGSIDAYEIGLKKRKHKNLLSVFTAASDQVDDRTETSFRDGVVELRSVLEQSPHIRYRHSNIRDLGHAKTPMQGMPQGLAYVYAEEVWGYSSDERKAIFANKRPIEYRDLILDRTFKNHGVRQLPPGWEPVFASSLIQALNIDKAIELLSDATRRNPTDLDQMSFFLKLLRDEDQDVYTNRLNFAKRTVNAMNLSKDQADYWYRRFEGVRR